MRERKYVKFRVDMLSDTKSKIIDTKPERDLIHYVWMALVLLAGKVNLNGELYLSKNIPYTIETLAIEVGRGIEQVKMALEVFIELEMVEVTKENIYIVKNFAKHQNIKVKENTNFKDKVEKAAGIVPQISLKEDTDVKNKEEVLVKENFENEVDTEKIIKLENEINAKQKESDENYKNCNLEVVNKNIKLPSENISGDMDKDSKDRVPVLLEKKKNERLNKKKKKDNDINCVDGENEEDEIVCFYDGEIPLREGERVIKAWSFV